MYFIEASLSERNLVKGTVMYHGASRAGDRLRPSSLSLSECVCQGTIARGRLCRSPHTSVGREVREQGDRQVTSVWFLLEDVVVTRK